MSSSFCRCLSCFQRCWISFISGACAWRFCIEWIWRTVTGTSTRRTSTTRATIDQAHESPAVEWNHSSRFVRRSSIGFSGLKTPITCSRPSRAPVGGTACGRRPGRRRRGSRGCSGGAASKRGCPHGRGRAHGTRRARTASTTGGTCTCRRASGGRTSAARPGRGRCRSTSCLHLADHLAHLIDEPGVVAARRGLREARPRDEDIVPPRRDAVGELGPHRAELPLDAVSRHGRPDGARHGEAEPGRAVGIVLTSEPVERHGSRRDRPSLPVDRVEVAGTGQALPSLHGAVYADRRLRPLARRRLRIAWPPRVDMRARKPCLRLRRRTFGWYVRFTVERRPWDEPFHALTARRSGEYRRASEGPGYPQRDRLLAGSKRLLTGNGCRRNGRRPHRFPQLWRSVWRRENILQICVFYPPLRCDSEPGRGVGRVVCSGPFLRPEGAPTTAWRTSSRRPPTASGRTSPGDSGRR